MTAVEPARSFTEAFANIMGGACPACGGRLIRRPPQAIQADTYADCEDCHEGWGAHYDASSAGNSPVIWQLMKGLNVTWYTHTGFYFNHRDGNREEDMELVFSPPVWEKGGPQSD
jgi:hypothetical protein